MNTHRLLEGFALAQSRRGLRTNTIHDRDRLLRSFFHSLDPHTTTTGDIEQWLDNRQLVMKSRSVYLSNLAAFFAWMVDEAERDDNPVAKIPRPRLPRTLPRPAPDWALRIGLDAAPPRLRCWLLLAAYQGFRCFEIASLCREDVLDGQDPALIRVSDGKGGHQRVLPLNPLVLDALRAFGMPTRGPIFRFTQRRKNGEQISARAVSDYVNDHLRRNAASATAHQFRHSFGTICYRRTRDPFLVQTLMGHADPRSTAGYVEITPSVDAVDVVTRFGAD